MPDEIHREGSTKRSISYRLVLSTDKYYLVLSHGGWRTLWHLLFKRETGDRQKVYPIRKISTHYE